jgi:clan AA aspartic protease (TIGR02281 family)
VKYILKKFQPKEKFSKNCIVFLIVFLFPFVFYQNSLATLYKWKDKSGSIHFTSDPETIPKEFRNQSKEFSPGPAPKISQPPHPLPDTQPIPNAKTIVPLNIKGNQFFVKTRLNDNVEVNLLLDTGASVLVISEETGNSLGFSRLDNMPQIEAQTAGGKIWTPLIYLETVETSGAKAFGVETIIDEKLENLDGLLGMGFLEQFKMTLDRRNSQLILNSNLQENESLYGGRPLNWWIKKIRYFHTNKIFFERLAKKYARDDHKKTYNIEKTAEHYDKLFRRTQSSAQELNVPLD